MATGGPPQSQLSLESCGVEEKRSTRGPLGLDTTQRETEVKRPANPGGASRLYTPSTPDDLSCYEDLQDRPKTGDNVGGYETEKAAVELETEAQRRAVTLLLLVIAAAVVVVHYSHSNNKQLAGKRMLF